MCIRDRFLGSLDEAEGVFGVVEGGQRRLALAEAFRNEVVEEVGKAFDVAVDPPGGAAVVGETSVVPAVGNAAA